ncbi:MAG TPA: undecaprenyl-diphosphatase UppP [Bryobacteraceae bacterium]|nr:undecaprenyl-diphosphatase UppP [Bryobacteraceae bacterium]
MPVYQVVILSLVQGLTEFLPISSTAHLYLTSWLLGWKAESLTFDIALHVGTLLAVLVYFFKDWLQLIAHGFGIDYGDSDDLRRNRALLWLLAAGSIPLGVFGLLFQHQAESTWRNPFVIGTMLVVVGVVMAIGERVGRKMRNLGNIHLGDALSIGLAQALAIVPGTSRSGITITAALFRGIDRPAAARFSFLLSTPAIAAAAAKAFHDLYKSGGIEPGMQSAFVLGVVLSAISGWIVIAWFLRYLQRQSLAFFVYYRVIFGIIVLALALIRRPA